MNRLKEIRKNQKLNQTEFAKILNVSQQTISNWEHGNTDIDLETLNTISITFNVTTDYILGIEEKIKSVPIKRPDYELSEKFLQDYAELLKDKSFVDTAKLYNEISPELRAMALGYLVGLLRSYNIDTKKILGY